MNIHGWECNAKRITLNDGFLPTTISSYILSLSHSSEISHSFALPLTFHHDKLNNESLTTYKRKHKYFTLSKMVDME